MQKLVAQAAGRVYKEFEQIFIQTTETS